MNNINNWKLLFKAKTYKAIIYPIILILLFLLIEIFIYKEKESLNFIFQFGILLFLFVIIIILTSYNKIYTKNEKLIFQNYLGKKQERMINDITYISLGLTKGDLYIHFENGKDIIFFVFGYKEFVLFKKTMIKISQIKKDLLNDNNQFILFKNGRNNEEKL